MMRKNIYTIYLLCVAVVLLAGCSDAEYFSAGSSTLTLQIPNVTSTRTAGNESNITDNEGQVSDLWFMAFPQEGAGERMVRRLAVDQLHPGEYQTFNLELKYGTYHIYVAANLPGLSAMMTEDDLKHFVLSFKEGDNLVLPSTSPVGLPMFYAADTPLTISTRGTQEIIADLVFLCAKVKYKIAFDNTDFSQSAFGGNGFKITDLTIKNIATSSSLFNQESHTVAELKELAESGTLTLEDQQKKWNYTGTVYLPEHYSTDENSRTCLEITGVEIALDNNGAETAVKHTYLLPLGGDPYNDATAKGETFKGGDLQRGTFYDITAKIAGKGEEKLDVSLETYKWSIETINVNFDTTELWISRTGNPTSSNYDVKNKEAEQILVNSLYNDSIQYETNASSLDVRCVDEIEGTPIIQATMRNDRIVFSINPEIPHQSYGETKGSARVAIKANNLIKYVDVQYDVTAYLRVSPLEVMIQTNAGGAGMQNNYIVSFETNLGAIEITPMTLSAAGTDNGRVTITCDNTNTAQGTISLKPDENTKSAWEGTFTVSPKNSEYSSYAQKVRVIVTPQTGDYIIHFIAINDDFKNGGEAVIHQNLNDGTRPTDGWSNHNIYIYTQYGITTADGNRPGSIWYFFETQNLSKESNYWPGVPMEQAPNNAGWMYYKLSKEFKGKCDLVGTSDKYPKPGETLIMFNDNASPRHRYPYEMEPGVSLFDFLNKEGWFVYDPTSNAYEFSADKPELALITYTMYTKDPAINRWYRNYGPNLSIWGGTDSSTGDGYKNMRVTKNGQWNKTELDLWAAISKEGKTITVKNEEKDTSYGIMFDGKKFKNNTGYYDNGAWHEGKPSGTN